VRAEPPSLTTPVYDMSLRFSGKNDIDMTFQLRT
jgi:hypothetical protein